MNRLLSMSLISFCLLILTGCNYKGLYSKMHDSEKSDAPTVVADTTDTNDAPTVVVDNTDTSDAPAVVVDDTDTGGDIPTVIVDDTDKNDTPTVVVDDTDKNDTPTVVVDNTDNNSNLATCEVTPPDTIERFARVQVTYGLLDDIAFIPGVPGVSGETGGLLPITITAPVNAGSLEILVDSTETLIEGQLLTYLGTNGVHRVGQIDSISIDKITLKEGLLFDLAADDPNDPNDQSLWNFYDDATHPNAAGFKALADFAFSTADAEFDLTNDEPAKKHVLLGDSWFKRDDTSPFEAHLTGQLVSDSIANEGIGGQNLCDLLARVETVMTTHNPDYVWINSSINDFFNGVTAPEYRERMKTLIGKIQEGNEGEANGAEVIVMDPAPGMLNQSTADGTTTFSQLSARYATQILELLAETNQSAEQ